MSVCCSLLCWLVWCLVFVCLGVLCLVVCVGWCGVCCVCSWGSLATAPHPRTQGHIGNHQFNQPLNSSPHQREPSEFYPTGTMHTNVHLCIVPPSFRSGKCTSRSGGDEGGPDRMRVLLPGATSVGLWCFGAFCPRACAVMHGCRVSAPQREPTARL